MACQVGATNAAPVPSKNVKTSNTIGVTLPNASRRANIAAVTAINRLTAISIRRRSMISAMAPAGSANNTTGSVVAACTAATMFGVGSNVVISQPAPTSCIHVPMLDNTVAHHRTANVRCLNGAHGEGFSSDPVVITGRRGEEFIYASSLRVYMLSIGMLFSASKQEYVLHLSMSLRQSSRWSFTSSDRRLQNFRSAELRPSQHVQS